MLAKKYKANYERNKKSQPEYGEKTCTGIRDAIKTGICSDREWNKKSQLEYGEKTCTGIRDAIKTGICSEANKK